MEVIDMKYMFSFIVFLYLLIPINIYAFTGNSYVVMEGDSGQVLENQDMYDIQSVASISKIMTAIIAIENQSLDTMITVDEIVNEAWGSGIYVHIGDEISLQDLLYGLLLRSGNDGALVIAQSVAGDVCSFVELMNQKAKELNMEYTSFSNPTGLDEQDDGNLSCAYDMAILMRYCYQNPIFQEIIGTQEYQRLDGNGTWINKNKLLEMYEYCVGGKTGYTTLAKRTLVTIASKENMELIIVTLNCGDDFEFHQSKYIEYYELYESKLLLQKGILNIDSYRYILLEDIEINILEDDEVSIQFNNDILYVLKNNQIVEQHTLIKYRFIRCFFFNFKQIFIN